MSRVTAVVPILNGRELVARVLDDLRAQTRPPDEVLVVDDGSTDGSAEVAEARGARVLRMGTNAGFSRAVNRGIGASRTPLVAILNADVELAPDWLEKLVAALDSPDVWFATPRILDVRRRDRIDGTYDLLCRGACAWRTGQGFPDGPLFRERRAVYSAPWTAVLFRAGLFARVGVLDERLDAYLEDVDFGLRCALAGLSGVYVPEAVAFHYGSATLGRWHPRTVRRIARNQVLLAAKYYPCRYWWPVLVAQALWGLVALRHHASAPYLRGKLEGLGRFAAVRRQFDPKSAARLAEVVESGEREIRNIQREYGFETYWKWYFLLTGGGTK